MTAANHLPPENFMDPDLQELESIKYLFNPLLFVKLRSGKIGICSGLGGRTVRTIVDATTVEGCSALVDIVMEAARNRARSAAEERTSLERSLDLDDITLDVFDLKDIKL